MKTLRIAAIAAAVLMFSVSASAQRDRYGYPHNHSHFGERYSMNNVHVSYNPLTAKLITKGAKSVTNMSGIAIGWAQLTPLASELPLLIEYGADAQYSFLMKKNDSRNMFSLNVPVSVVYQLGVPGSSVALMPYAGLDFGYNLFGSQKVAPFDRVGYFSDLDFTRFMVGGHVGVKLMLGQFFVSVAYQGDFNELAENVKYTQAQFSLGMFF